MMGVFSVKVQSVRTHIGHLLVSYYGYLHFWLLHFCTSSINKPCCVCIHLQGFRGEHGMNYFSSFLHVRDHLIDRAAHVDFPVPRTVLECFHLTHTVMHMSREKHEDD